MVHGFTECKKGLNRGPHPCPIRPDMHTTYVEPILGNKTGILHLEKLLPSGKGVGATNLVTVVEKKYNKTDLSDTTHIFDQASPPSKIPTPTLYNSNSIRSPLNNDLAMLKKNASKSSTWEKIKRD